MLFVLVSILPSVLCWTYQDELNFRKAHFKNYDKNIRPLKYMNDVVQINAALQLNSAQKFDIVNGQITVHGYLILKWYDELLSWDSTVNNITNITVFNKMIWHPSVMICNTESLIDIKSNSQVFLNSTGSVEMFIPMSFQSGCDVDAYAFPFDEHLCHISICFTDYDVRELNLQYLNCTPPKYLNDHNWLLTMSCRIKNDLFSEGFVELKFTRKIQVKSLSHLLPVFIFLILNIMAGHLPVESGEKVSFATTVFLTNIVNLGNINSNLPKEPTNIPLIFSCYLVLTFLSGITVVGSIVTSKRFWKRKSPETVALNKVGLDNSQTQLENQGGTDTIESDFKSLPIKECSIRKKCSSYCGFESLMYNIMLAMSVFYAIAFTSLFSLSISTRN